MAFRYLVNRKQMSYVLVRNGSKLFSNVHERHYTVLVEADIMDNFTSQLMQKKSANWDILAQRKLINNVILKENRAPFEYNICFEQLSAQELDNTVREAVDSYNIVLLKYVISKCAEYNKLPTCTLLLQMLSALSCKGEKDSIEKIVDLCIKLKPSFLKDNSSFFHYLAEAMWIKGNIGDAIVMFENVYRDNVFLRRKVNSMLKYLIPMVVPNRSEAVLVILISYGERIANEFNDFTSLVHLWRMCFSSEWYSDQCIAFDLLERHAGLYAILEDKFTCIVAVALKNRRYEVVYRLLEVLLISNYKQQYAQVLEVLFNYRVHQGDLRSCLEIMQWSVEHKVDLPALQLEKFLNLIVPGKNGIYRKANTHKRTSCNFEYKF